MVRLIAERRGALTPRASASRQQRLAREETEATEKRVQPPVEAADTTTEGATAANAQALDPKQAAIAAALARARARRAG